MQNGLIIPRMPGCRCVLWLVNRVCY